MTVCARVCVSDLCERLHRCGDPALSESSLSAVVVCSALHHQCLEPGAESALLL